MTNTNNKDNFIPVVAMRDIVVYPQMMAPIFISRKMSAIAIENAILTEDHYLILLAQKDPSLEEPEIKDLYQAGVLIKAVQILKFPDGTIKALADGTERVKIVEIKKENDFYQAKYEVLQEIKQEDENTKALINLTIEKFKEYIKKTTKINVESFITLAEIKEAGKLADIIATYLSIELPEKQKILEVMNTYERLEEVSKILAKELELLGIEETIQEKVKFSLGKTQKEFLTSLDRAEGDIQKGRVNPLTCSRNDMGWSSPPPATAAADPAPATPANWPGKSTVVGSTNDLKPESFSLFRRTGIEPER